MTHPRAMTDAELQAAIDAANLRWDTDDFEGGGSPRESLDEWLGDLYAERERRGIRSKPMPDRGALLRQRLQIADECIRKGLNLDGFVKVAGMKPSNASRYLSRHSPDRLDALAGAIPAEKRHEVLVRLLLVSSVKGIPGAHDRLATALGCTRSNLYMFVQRWAPDGLDAAIDTLMGLVEPVPEETPCTTSTPA